MRALVIGGTGLIGLRLVEQLLDRGDDVTIMHRGSGTPFGGRVAELRADRNDPAAVAAAVRGRAFDVVFDNVYDWQRGTTAGQVMGTVDALDPAPGRYVFMSSVAVYPDGRPLVEDAPLVGDDEPNPYRAQKAASERALAARHREGRLAAVTLRPAFVYGPDNTFDRESWFWDRLVADRPIIIPDDGQRTMQWVYGRDVARAAVLAAAVAGAVGHAFNLAAPPITQVDFVRALARAAGVDARLVPVPRERLQAAGGELFAPPLYFGTFLDIPPITVSSDRAREVLGLEFVPFEEGLRETFAWYRALDRPAPDTTWEERLLAEVRGG